MLRDLRAPERDFQPDTIARSKKDKREYFLIVQFNITAYAVFQLNHPPGRQSAKNTT